MPRNITTERLLCPKCNRYFLVLKKNYQEKAFKLTCPSCGQSVPKKI